MSSRPASVTDSLRRIEDARHAVQAESREADHPKDEDVRMEIPFQHLTFFIWKPLSCSVHSSNSALSPQWSSFLRAAAAGAWD